MSTLDIKYTDGTTDWEEDVSYEINIAGTVLMTWRTTQVPDTRKHIGPNATKAEHFDKMWRPLANIKHFTVT